MQNEPDRLFLNGTIWTGNLHKPWVEALAIQNDRIVATGSSGQILALGGPGTESIDLQGAFVVPGFIDNHTHFLTGGFQLASVDLRSANSTRDFSTRIKDFVSTVPPGRWITGGDWDHEAWGGNLPVKEWVDDFSPDNPIFVNRLDGHMALANSVVLRIAGISAETPDPDGGTIVKDSETGEPTGVLKDEAMSLVYRVMPDPSDEEMDRALRRAIDHALSKGITQIHDVGSFGGWSDLETFHRAYEARTLGIRIYAFVPLSTGERLAQYVAENGKGDYWLHWGGLKGFVDGSLGSTTALFYDPYEDDPETSGLLIVDTTAVRDRILYADKQELQLAIHAIGDKANDWLLSVFADAASENGKWDRRSRIEHAQHLSPTAISKFKELGVTASMQPYHAIDDGRWAEKRIGAERIKTTYPFRSLLDANANLTFGSDWTVAPLDPLLGIYAAVTRRTIDGANPDGWIPTEKITVAEALRAYTVNSAYAAYMEEVSGSLEADKLADFVVLSENLFKIDPVAIPDVQIVRTVIGGQDRYEIE